MVKKILLVSPAFIDSYKIHASTGSSVKLAFSLSKIYKVIALTTGQTKRLERKNKNLRVISTRGFLIPDPVNYIISFSLLVKFWKLLSSYKPDLVIVSKNMFFTSFVIPLAKFRKVPVLTILDTFPGINWFPANRLVSIVMWFYARIIGLPLLWMSNKVVLLHPGLEKIAAKFKLNYVTIPNGVEGKFLKELEKPEDIVKNNNEFWVGFVGRPESIKGFDKLKLITNKFKNKYPKIKFVLAGGSLKPGSEDNLVYLGFRRDIMNIYQMFDVLILPSRAEGLPNVVMEAMAQKVPVIANNVGGVASIITHLKNGVLVDPSDLNGIEEYISKLYKDDKLRKSLGEQSKKTIEEKFNWDKLLLRYKNLIEELV